MSVSLDSVRRRNRLCRVESLEERLLLSVALPADMPVERYARHVDRSAALPAAPRVTEEAAADAPGTVQTTVDPGANPIPYTTVYSTSFELAQGFVTGTLRTQSGWNHFAGNTNQPKITNVSPSLGTQHLRVARETALAPDVHVGGFSPDLNPRGPGAYRVSVDIRVTGTFGATYSFAAQSSSQDAVTGWMDLDFLGTIWVFSDTGWHDTGVAWDVGAYRTATIEVDPIAAQVRYFYDGDLVYTSGLLDGTSVEQVVLFSDNWNEGEVGDFDNLVIQSAPNLATVRPYAWWGDRIVVSSRPGTNTEDRTLYPTDTLYVDWAVANSGGLATGTAFHCALYVDGLLRQTWNCAALAPCALASQQDYVLGSLPVGTHTLVLVADTGGSVSESDESDNTFTKTITISPLGEVAGVKWHDFDGDGDRDEGEPGLAGWRVYLDLNRNGQCDAGEPQAATDSEGNYTIAEVRAGRYALAAESQPGWIPTFPAQSPAPAAGVLEPAASGAGLGTLEIIAGQVARAAPSGARIEGDRIVFDHRPGAAAPYEEATAAAPPAASMVFPSSYDLRSEGAVTPVRDQGQSGACWAFATYGSLESAILKQGGGTVDLSENNLKNYHSFDFYPDDGGWGDMTPITPTRGLASMSQAYLSRGSGPLLETDDPYHDWDDVPSPGGSPAYYVRESVQLRTRDDIKAALMTSGAVDTPLYMSTSYLNKTKFTYYYPGTSSANHEVTIVGWDDAKATAAPTAGAWLIKNSWGTSWGQGGYFWLSYYDTVGGKTATLFHDAVPADTYSHIHYYDDYGCVGAYAYPYACNAFTPIGNENLKAVQIYTLADNASYQIQVYDSLADGALSGLLASASGHCAYPGYHTIDLPWLVPVSGGDTYYVAVRIVDGGAYPQAADWRAAGYSSNSSASPGQSYFSADGLAWTDLTTSDATANFCIKALSVDVVPPNTHQIVLAAGETLLGKDFGDRSTCSLDVDGDGTVAPLTDGILILRFLFDPAGQWRVDDVLGNGAVRTAPPVIKASLDDAPMLDADGNGLIDPLTDGILILRYLFEPGAQWAVADALGPDATRTTADDVRNFLDQFNPALRPAPAPAASDWLVAGDLAAPIEVSRLAGADIARAVAAEPRGDAAAAALEEDEACLMSLADAAQINLRTADLLFQGWNAAPDANCGLWSLSHAPAVFPGRLADESAEPRDLQAGLDRLLVKIDV